MKLAGSKAWLDNKLRTTEDLPGQLETGWAENPALSVPPGPEAS